MENLNYQVHLRQLPQAKLHMSVTPTIADIVQNLILLGVLHHRPTIAHLSAAKISLATVPMSYFPEAKLIPQEIKFASDSLSNGCYTQIFPFYSGAISTRRVCHLSWVETATPHLMSQIRMKQQSLITMRPTTIPLLIFRIFSHELFSDLRSNEVNWGSFFFKALSLSHWGHWECP